MLVQEVQRLNYIVSQCSARRCVRQTALVSVTFDFQDSGKIEHFEQLLGVTSVFTKIFTERSKALGDSGGGVKIFEIWNRVSCRINQAASTSRSACQYETRAVLYK